MNPLKIYFPRISYLYLLNQQNLFSSSKLYVFMTVEFKTDREKQEYWQMNIALKVVADYFIDLSLKLGITPVVTRILEPVPGESGVHQAGRAIDFRNEHGGRFLYTDAEALQLVEAMNKRFPRTDGRLVCIHHAAINHSIPNGPRAPYHFHCQIPYLWAADYQAVPRKNDA